MGQPEELGKLLPSGPGGLPPGPAEHEAARQQMAPAPAPGAGGRMRLFVLSARGVFAARGVGWAADNPPSYVRDVKPLLQTYCARCHRPGKMKGRYDVTAYTALVKGGKKGRGVVPGSPERSW